MLIHTIFGKILKYCFLVLDYVRPVGELIVRLWLAKIFFMSGLAKVADWQSTVMLFTNVYDVPLLSPTVAAYIGTGFEFALPVLLVLGLGGRLSILIFFIYNIACVLSFHALWLPSGEAGLDQHINWGLLLLMLMFTGMGKISLDHLIHKYWGQHLK